MSDDKPFTSEELTNIPIPLEEFIAVYEDRSDLDKKYDLKLYRKIMKDVFSDVYSWKAVATLKICLIQSIYIALQLDASQENRDESEELK